MKLYIGSISRETTDNDIADFIKSICKADNITIIEDEITGLDHRYAIIKVKDESTAIKIIENLDNEKLKGCRVKIHRARVNKKDRRNSKRGGGRRQYDSPPNPSWKKK